MLAVSVLAVLAPSVSAMDKSTDEQILDLVASHDVKSSSDSRFGYDGRGFTYTSGSTEVRAPLSTGRSLTVSTWTDLDLEVEPLNVLATQGEIVGSDVLYRGSNMATSLLVQPKPGGFRLLNAIEGKTAPTSFSYQFSSMTGEPVNLALGDDGSVEVAIELADADGTVAEMVVGKIDPPWAVDSEGISVPTEFEVLGNSRLVQNVHHDSSTFSYPVVADPDYQGDCGILTCTIRLSRKITKYIRDKTNELAAIGAICSGAAAAAGAEPAAAVCAVLSGTLWYYSAKANTYYNNGNCIGFRVSHPLIMSLASLVNPIAAHTAVPTEVKRGTYNCA